VSEQERTTKVFQSYDQPIEIDLSRGAKGRYYWRISVKSESAPAALRQVQDIDQELRRKFVEASASELESGSPKPQPQISGSEEPYRRMEKAVENVKKAAEKVPLGGV
jgi:hypothetical protein